MNKSDIMTSRVSCIYRGFFMVFNSYSYIFIFLPLVVAGFHLLKRAKNPLIPKCFLLCASLFFYGLHNLKALVVLCVSIVLNYLISLLCLKKKKPALILGIVLDLGALVYCKYLLFFEGISNSLFHTTFTFSSLILPLGISFYTFSQIAYLSDCYKDPGNRCSFLDYAVFVSFFPKVTVGPIALSTEMVPEINRAIQKKIDFDKWSKAMICLSFGIAKKVLIADTLSKYVDWGYANIDALGTTNAFLVMLSYTLQIYFDFSGYCDMARAVCLFLGFDLTRNFDSPYRSLSIAEFWKRWHMSLTRFFRVYVYFPLGGNRKGKVRTYINHMIVFLLSGLWHGASLNFLLWGAIHGAGIICSKLLTPFSVKWPKTLRFLLTFAFVNLTWVYFRAPDLTTAHAFFKELFTGGLVPINIEFIAAATPAECNILQWLVMRFTTLSTYYTGMVMILSVLLFALLASIFMKNTDERTDSFRPSPKLAAACTALLVMGILSLSEISKFIYVNF